MRRMAGEPGMGMTSRVSEGSGKRMAVFLCRRPPLGKAPRFLRDAVSRPPTPNPPCPLRRARMEDIAAVAVIVLVLVLAGAVSWLAARTGARPPACGWG